MSKELLFSITKKDFDISFFSGTGAGGQHRNRHMNCVRLKHKASGVTVTGQSHKSLEANKKEALNNLINNPKWALWHAQAVREALDKMTLEEKVDEMMAPENIKIEGRDKHGKWAPWLEMPVEENNRPEEDPNKWPNNIPVPSSEDRSEV